jgi:phage tail protein X
MATYRAKAGEMVDEICQLYYGRTAGVVEQVYEANRGLAELGPRLPAGTLVELPKVGQAETETVYPELWD